MDAPPCSFKLGCDATADAPAFSFNMRSEAFPLRLGKPPWKTTADDSSDAESSRDDASTAASTADSTHTRRQGQGSEHQLLPGHIQDLGFQPVIDLGVDEVAQMASSEVARLAARLAEVSAEMRSCDCTFERNRCIKRAMDDYATAIQWIQTISPVEEERDSCANDAGSRPPAGTTSGAAASPLSSPSQVAGGEAMGASILAMVQASPSKHSTQMLSTQPPPSLPPTSSPASRQSRDSTRQDMPPPPNSPPRFPLASIPALPSMSVNLFGMPDGADMQSRQQHPQQQMHPHHAPQVFQTASAPGCQPQNMLSSPPCAAQQPGPHNAWGLQQPQQQSCIPGMHDPLYHHNQHPIMSGAQFGPNMQMSHGSQQSQHGVDHFQDARQFQTVHGSQRSPAPQNAHGMFGMPGMQGSCGGGMMSGYQLVAVPAGVAPPEGAIPAVSGPSGGLQPQAPLQLNSQWCSDSLHTFDAQSSWNLMTNASKDARRFRILDPKTGEEVAPDL